VALYVNEAVSPYAPTVIKELLNEVIETGHGQQVRRNIARHLFSSAAAPPPHHLRAEHQMDTGLQRLTDERQSDVSELATATVDDAGYCTEQLAEPPPTRQGEMF